ncbi:hypothetical protein [Vibrio metschnikovii]|uniref:Uncharacterized protein n=1 Tax=Vibrio metschnikovii TaxID=28172 RepID=A0A9X0R6E7_VIBME|nr:hypothetical protein [Vibrio metschnikovii]MBC5849676.1 hypothetical protein [Vibrio metschnikovii]
MTRKHGSLSFSNIRSMRGKSLRTIIANPDKVPSYSGVYIWRYWPQPRSYTKSDLLDFLKKIILEFPVIEKELTIKNDSITYSRYALGYDCNNPFSSLGLTEKKITQLETLLENDEKIEPICNVFEMMLYMLPPLYIGKANIISDRINQHINRRSSKLLDKLDKVNISHGDVYISFIEDKLSLPDKDMSDLMEIIFQRVTNPVFTDRQG